MLAISQKKAIQLRDKAQQNPNWFIKEVLGDEPWGIQKEIIDAVRDHADVSVKGCHGPGKSWLAARIALAFLFSYISSIVITTAPSLRQVKGILWKEIGVAHANSKYKLGGTCLLQDLKIDRDWFAMGFTAPDYDPNRFQGFHQKDLLVVVDEASGVTTAIMQAIDGILSSNNSHKLEIGNPTDINSDFAKSFKNPMVKKFTISAYDTPNFTAFGITEEDIFNNTWQQKIGDAELPMPELVTPNWVYRIYKKYGKNHPFYIAKVLAEFPKVSKDTLIPLSWIEQAQNRTLEPVGPNELAVDVARFGDDNSVFGHRRGPVYRIKDKTSKEDLMQTTGRAVMMKIETGAEKIKVDEIGIGAGVVDRLREQKYNVVGHNGARAANDPERFVNKRAEDYWHLRELFEEGLIDIDPEDEDLAAQLADIKWKVGSGGRIQVEDKADIKKRNNGTSPDDADTCMTAYSDIEDDRAETW